MTWRSWIRPGPLPTLRLDLYKQRDVLYQQRKLGKKIYTVLVALAKHHHAGLNSVTDLAKIGELSCLKQLEEKPKGQTRTS